MSQSRGSIPEALLRPLREAVRYPIDIVIGELGQGTSSLQAFNFAGRICTALMSARMDNLAFMSANRAVLERHLSALGEINPQSFRIGGGREEADGAYSFLVRFIGREQGITGELYIRYVLRMSGDEEEEQTAQGSWTFDELLLEAARDHETEMNESIYRVDLNPYERFF
ncbi:MAG: hypothetical protein FWB83_04700 [Treponema sp.]|nr:hypothetical protein [Treponema sp.]